MSIIAISRGTFSGGQAVAQHVSRRLGYPCVSREEIATGLTWYGVPTEDTPTTAAGSLLLRERLGGERGAYLKSFRAALCERARSGDLVYHGHVAHMLLPGISHVLCVRIVADMDYRIEAAMAQQHLSRQDTIAYIEKADRERQEWAQFLYGVDWDDSTLYDMVLNVSRLKVTGAGDAIVRMAILDEFRPTVESLRAMENLLLENRVSAVLARDGRTAAADLRVVARDGLITVTGAVYQEEVIDHIPVVATTIKGVLAVRCDVGLVPAVA